MTLFLGIMNVSGKIFPTLKHICIEDRKHNIKRTDNSECEETRRFDFI